MEILTQEQTAQFPTKRLGMDRRISKNEAVHEQIKNLQEGETLLLLKTEWIGKTSPFQTLGGLKEKLNGRRFHCFTLQDGTGWLISPRKAQ